MLLIGFSATIVAEPVSIHWSSNLDEVDGYRIYKGDANSRVFVKATTDTKATVDIVDGESLFVTAFHGVLESRAVSSFGSSSCRAPATCSTGTTWRRRNKADRDSSPDSRSRRRRNRFPSSRKTRRACHKRRSVSD